MADIRIKDLATTATTTASDDFMAVDGSTNGTRKMNAAAPAFLTSVTTPSLTSPASTNLTLAGGSGNTNVVLIAGGTGNVGVGTTIPAAPLEVVGSIKTGSVEIQSIALSNSIIGDNIYYDSGFKYRATAAGSVAYFESGEFQIRTAPSGSAGAAATLTQVLTVKQNGNVGIGTTTPASAQLVIGNTTGSAVEMLSLQSAFANPSGAKAITWRDGTNILGQVDVRYASGMASMAFGHLYNAGYQTGDLFTIQGNGTVSIASATAGSAGAGALVVTGGLATGAASYIGGNLTVAGTGTSSFGGNIQAGANAVFQTASGIAVFRSPQELYLDSGSTNNILLRPGLTTALTLAPTTLAATFAGAVNWTADSTVARVGSGVLQLASTSGGQAGFYFAPNGTNAAQLNVAAGNTFFDYAGTLNVRAGFGGSNTFTLTSAGAATFAGTVIAPAATASLAPLRIPHSCTERADSRCRSGWLGSCCS